MSQIEVAYTIFYTYQTSGACACVMARIKWRQSPRQFQQNFSGLDKKGKLRLTQKYASYKKFLHSDLVYKI